jgi:general stress protein YciG
LQKIRGEIDAIRRAMEAEEKAAARKRQREGGRAGGQASGNLPQASESKTRDKIGAFAGVSGCMVAKVVTLSGTPVASRHQWPWWRNLPPHPPLRPFGTKGGALRHVGMKLERVMMWMAVVGVIGFAVTLAWMLAKGW